MPPRSSGDFIEPLQLQTLGGRSVEIPSGEAPWVHLQFRRFAGCPICNLHLRSMARRIEEIRQAGIQEVVLFHSSAETMRPFQGDLPFDVVPDPGKVIYRRFGVQASAGSLLHPRAWLAFLRGVAAKTPSSSVRGEGGHWGRPADFLIDGSGRIAACHYGAHADDQWSVDELLALVAAAGEDMGGAHGHEPHTEPRRKAP